MEYLLFEILYRGLNYEKMRTSEHIKKRQITDIRKHMALLKMVLNLINAIYYKVGNGYCNAIKNKIVETIKNDSEYTLKYYHPLFNDDNSNFESNSDYEKILNLINYIFEMIDLSLSEEKPNMLNLNILFRSAHNLPRCMLKKGYLDKSYVHNISEEDCIEYSVSNMDVKLKSEISGLI
jgi:hypothetical protein